MPDRYSAHGSEAEFEPDSNNRVLRNLLGITRVREMSLQESSSLIYATQHMIDVTNRDQSFTENHICYMHKVWLGRIYKWAGQYRGVNIRKGNFMFAAAAQVSRLMVEFENGPLRDNTPCHVDGITRQACALATVHVEFILIHPFRDGNGRCARLLAVLMGLQAGLPALDFGGIRSEEKRRYIAAIHAGLSGDYHPMTLVFQRVIERTLRLHASA